MALSSVTEDKLFEGPLSSCNEDVLLVVVVRTETISFYASKSSARKSEQASGRHKPRASGPLSLGPFDEPCQFSRLLGVFRTTSRQHVRQQRGCHRTEAVRRARQSGERGVSLPPLAPLHGISCVVPLTTHHCLVAC